MSKILKIDNFIEGEPALWLDDLRYGQQAHYAVDIEVEAYYGENGSVTDIELITADIEYYDFNSGNSLGSESWDLQDLLDLHPEALIDIKNYLED